jgi:multidrug efflux pump
MTSIAFIMGVWPLLRSTGAGSEMRHAMGVAVFAGMIGVTLFGLLFTPVFFTLLRRRRAPRTAEPRVDAPPHNAQPNLVSLSS